MRDTTGKIESEIKEVKDQLASLATSGAGQLLEIEKKMAIICISSQAPWAEVVVVV